MRENRISSRSKLMSVAAKISADGGESWMDIISRDISDGGIGFTSMVEYPKGTVLKLYGAVTDFMRTMSIECDIKVVFAGKEGNEFVCGCKFLNLPRQEHTALSIFIELLMTRHPSLEVD
jgi:c-di-GMP-binding flagellar brake protein YcgR